VSRDQESLVKVCPSLIQCLILVSRDSIITRGLDLLDSFDLAQEEMKVVLPKFLFILVSFRQMVSLSLSLILILIQTKVNPSSIQG
jgi:hypothetical protein